MVQQQLHTHELKADGVPLAAQQGQVRCEFAAMAGNKAMTPAETKGVMGEMEKKKKHV